MEALIPTAGAEHGDGEEKEVPRWSSGSDPCQMCTDVPSVPLDSASWAAELPRCKARVTRCSVALFRGLSGELEAAERRAAVP